MRKGTILVQFCVSCNIVDDLHIRCIVFLYRHKWLDRGLEVVARELEAAYRESRERHRRSRVEVKPEAGKQALMTHSPSVLDRPASSESHRPQNR